MWEAFGWGAVDCFLRPQSHLVERARPGAADAFLLLLSLYRAHGGNECFGSEEKGHFFFLRQVAGPALGLDFLIDPYPEPYDLQAGLERAMAAGEPIIVPACARGAPDVGHYYLVVREEGRELVFLDSAERAPYEETSAYRELRIGKDALHALVERFFASGAGRALQSPLREPGLWGLRVQPRAGAAPAPPLAGLVRRMLEGTGFRRGASVDRRHLRRLRGMDRSWSADLKKRSLKLYLKEANLSSLHLPMASQALVDQDTPSSAFFARDVEEHLRRTRKRRENVMVEALVRPETVNWPAIEEGLDLEWAGMLRLLASVTREA